MKKIISIIKQREVEYPRLSNIQKELGNGLGTSRISSYWGGKMSVVYKC